MQLEKRFRGPKGPPGLQGIAGRDCICTSEKSRYISSGGHRTLFPETQKIILDSQDRIVLFLPEIQVKSEEVEDSYYNSILYSIFCSKGGHILKSQSVPINEVFFEIEIESNKKYEVVSTPKGWKMLIFESTM